MLFGNPRQASRILKLSSPYPSGAGNFSGSGQTFPSDHHLFVDFRRNDQSWK